MGDNFTIHRGFTEPHVYINEATDEITGFDESSHIFKAERDVLAANGINIHDIKTYPEYALITERLNKAIYEIVQAKALSRPGKSIEHRYIQAVFRGNAKECERLFALMKKRQSLGLKLVP